MWTFDAKPSVCLGSDTNTVTAEVLTDLLAELLDAGYSRIDVILDQLNTHWRVDLVGSVARLCQLPTPPAAAIESGQQRRDWLEGGDKPIVFHFTPKHASWLNPIEICSASWSPRSSAAAPSRAAPPSRPASPSSSSV